MVLESVAARWRRCVEKDPNCWMEYVGVKKNLIMLVAFPCGLRCLLMFIVSDPTRVQL